MNTQRVFDLLVFDWDGTLVDSIEPIVECTRRALADIGCSEVADGSIRQAIGLGLGDSLARFLPDADTELVNRLRERYSSHWIETYHRLSLPFEASRAVVEELAAAGYLLAVATAKSRRGLLRDFARTGLGELFHATRTVDEAPPKPHPEMLLQLLAELGVQAGRALMIGDTVWDLQMAANAGIRSLAVASGAQPREQLARSVAVACLSGIAELPVWLATAGASPCH